ncbi:MAG: DUF3604 domain-containing protein, partial [Planctomycetaceae bacterium]
MTTHLVRITCLLVGLLPAVLVCGQDAGTPSAENLSAAGHKRPYSPYAGGAVPTRVFWGDTHLHTSFSTDAGAFGNRLGLEEAYRFARGEELQSTSAGPVKLARPLDFLVIADHSDNMGFFPDLLAGDPAILADPKGREWNERVKAGEGVGVALEIIDLFSRGKLPPKLIYYPDTKLYRNAWNRTIDAAEKYNAPGRFTAFIGYEWTSQVPPGQNLHRVVIYRDGADKARQTVPATTYPPQGSSDPEFL